MLLAPATDARHADRLLVVIGTVSGASVALARLAAASDLAGVTWLLVLTAAVVAAQGGAAIAWLLRALLRWGVGRLSRSHAVVGAYTQYDTLTYAVFLLTLSTAGGVQLVAPVVLTIVALFVAAQALLLRAVWPRKPRNGADRSLQAMSALFFVAGMAALMYQMAWQRMLVRYFGVTMESITIIVSAFMLGLGLGALAGGRMSRAAPARLPLLFVGCELGVGLFGLFSQSIIRAVGDALQLAPLPFAALAIYAVLAVPTFLMGATLPVLVAWMQHAYRGVGHAVARLYFVNTLGSALGCVLAVDVIFAFTGLRGATVIAAGCNVGIAVLAFVVVRRAPALERADG